MLIIPLHQRTASFYSRYAQIAFVVLGVGATGLAAIALRARRDDGLAPITIPVSAPVKPSRPGPAVRDDHFDPVSTAARISLFGNSPVEAAKVEEPVIPGGGDPPPIEDTAVKFLGALIEPTRRVALLKIGEHQRLLGPGQSFGEVTVVSVTDESVEIKVNGVSPRTLTRQARSGPTVTYLSAAPAAMTPGNDAGSFAGTTLPGPPRTPRQPGGRANRAAEEAARRAREAAGEKP